MVAFPGGYRNGLRSNYGGVPLILVSGVMSLDRGPETTNHTKATCFTPLNYSPDFS